MKKSLLAVAVAAALPTLAQAQSSVTLFGLLDASVEYSDDQANATVAGNQVTIGQSGLRLQNGVGYGSRFGVRGTEDLGGGLKAIFTLEHRLNIDTGDTSGGAAATAGNQKFWNGQAWVGLSGGWGQLTAGRQYSPIFWALIPADFTSYGYYNNWAAGSGANVGVTSAFLTQGPIRLDNSLAYKSPTFGGLTVYATYAFGENLQNETLPGGSDQAGTGDIWGIAAGWQLGGLYLAAGYHSIDSKAFGTGITASAQAAFQDVLAVAASYKWSSFGVSLGYTQINFENVSGTDPSVSNILFSVFANLGPGVLFVNGYQTEFSDFAGARNDSGLQLGVTYRMPLSKRTDWYVAWGMNDYSGLQQTTASDIIDSQNRLAVGIRHLF